jgi:hypothetical protein
MGGGVEVEQDQPVHGQGFFGDRVTVPDERGLLLARVDIAVPRHREHVGVPGDHPVALVVEARRPARLLVPPDRRGPSQLGELLRRDPLKIELRIGEGEACGNARLSHHCLQM